MFHLTSRCGCTIPASSAIPVCQDLTVNRLVKPIFWKFQCYCKNSISAGCKDSVKELDKVWIKAPKDDEKQISLKPRSNLTSDPNMKVIIIKDWDSKEEIVRKLFLDSQTKIHIKIFQKLPLPKPSLMNNKILVMKPRKQIVLYCILFISLQTSSNTRRNLLKTENANPPTLLKTVFLL